MADEITVQSRLQIKKVSSTGITQLEYANRPGAFVADMTGAKGPTPGAVEVSTAGVSVDLSQLTTPGFCRIAHQGRASDGSLDETYFIEVGIWDPEYGRFYPMHELLPGEEYVARLARNLQQEYGTGTGTLGTETNRLRLKANSAACNVLVEAFEK